MAKFTFLEIHLDGAEISANAPFSGQSSAELDEASDPETDDEESGGISLVAPVVGLLVLAVVAVVLKYLLTGEELPDIDAEGPEIEIDS